MNMVNRAYIFDKDGVLMDTDRHKSLAWERALEKYDVDNGGEWYKSHIGTDGKVLTQRAVDEFNLPVSWEEFREERRRIYEEIRRSGTPLIVSSLVFLRKISREYFKIGMASSDRRERMEDEMRQVNVFDLFDVMVSTSDDTPNQSKPDPAIYLLAAEKLDVNPERCVAIEDTVKGVKSAISAGMRCVGFINPESGKQDLESAGAYITTNDLSTFDPFRLFYL